MEIQAHRSPTGALEATSIANRSRWERWGCAYCAATLLLIGCSFNEDGVAFGDAAPMAFDGRTDGPSSSPDAASAIDAQTCPSLTITPSNFEACDLAASNGTLDASGGQWQLNTDDLTLDFDPNDAANPPQPIIAATIAQPGGPELVLVVYDSITIQAGTNIAVLGSRPLALVSLDQLRINGSLFVGASYHRPGPGGGLSVSCASGEGSPGGTASMTGSGGGGGSFGAEGGFGAAGENAAGASTAAPGVTNGTPSLVPLRGGCNGGVGGNGGGNGGGGGGAVQLVANGTITISGVVIARGGAGRGAEGVRQGGGGGGSGGGLLLEAPRIEVTGALTANGGGGGEGCYSGGAFAGLDGFNGNNSSAVPALGGAGGGFGGDGGNGGAGPTAATSGFEGTSGDTPGAGGGGGGGSVGRIRLNAAEIATGGATISPAPQ